MSLRVWLPLNGDLRNNGLDNITVTNNGATVDNNGKIGKCYYFNGSNQIKISLPKNMTTIKNTSITAWIKSTGSVVALGGISYDNSTYGYSGAVTLYTSGWQFPASSGYKYVSGGSIANSQVWHHVACTIGEDKITTYLDGSIVKEGSLNTLTAVTTLDSTKNFIEIGQDSPGGDERLTGYVNDFRVYDHALSIKEVKELSKGLVCHYPLNQAFPIDNLVRNQTYAVYNNYASSGSTGTLVKTGERYNDCDVYRLTYTPNDTSLANVQSTLFSHGVYGFNKKFLANTKYCFWILWKAVSHPDTICGGTASNIGGWTEIPTKKFSGEWNIVGQYRNGTVTADKTDNIFTSFKTPSATSGTPIIIDFCCPHLVEGYDYILEENGYDGDVVTKIYDTSGYNYYGTPTGNLTVSSDSARNSLSTVFTGSQYIAIGNKLYNARDEMTVNLWCYKSNWNANVGTPFSSVESGGFGWQASGTNYNFYCGTGVSSNTYISSAVTTSSLSNGWHMLSATYDGLALRVYIDGVLKNTVTKYTIKTPIFYNVNSGMFISGESAGSLVSPSGGLYTGKISDVRIYCTALNENDIKELYQAPISISNNGSIFTQGEYVEV